MTQEIRLPRQLAKRVEALARRTGRTFEQTLSDVLRRGLQRDRIDNAVAAFLRGDITLQAAAETARLPPDEFLRHVSPQA